MAHSRFSPSATEREYSCPASFLRNEKLPNEQSVDAAHGTAAHHIGELCLTKDRDVDFYGGCTLAVDQKGHVRFVSEPHPVLDDEFAFEVDDEMISAVQRYVEWCRDLPGAHHVEIRVEHTDWCPDTDEDGFPLDPQFGTSDHNACIHAGERGYDESTLVVTDLKYGKGLKVFAFENKQAIKYALGAWKKFNSEYNFKRIVIRIAQPRLDHFDVWELSVEELLEWGEKIKSRLSLVFDKDAPFGPSEKACKFCRFAAHCKPLEQHIFSVRALEFDDLGEFVADEHTLTVDDLFAAWHMLPLIEIRKTHIEAEIAKHLGADESVGDLQLVEATTHRRWHPSKSQDAIVERLRKLGLPDHKIYKEREIRSPKQIQDALPKDKKDKIDGLVLKPKGGPVVASPSDRRPKYVKPELDLRDFDDDDGFGD